MKTGCPDCDNIQAETGSKIRLCPKHELEYLKWYAEKSKNEYEEAKRKYIY